MVFRGSARPLNKLWLPSRFRKPRPASRRGAIWFPGCCCDEPPPPPGPCWHVFDDFNRANSTTIGSPPENYYAPNIPLTDPPGTLPLWHELDGEWQIQSNTLRTSDSSASLRLTNLHVPRFISRITVDVKSSASGDKVRVYHSLRDDTDGSGWAVELEIGTGKVRLVGKANDTLDPWRTMAECDVPLATGTFHNISICTHLTPVEGGGIISGGGTLLLVAYVNEVVVIRGYIPRSLWHGDGCFLGFEGDVPGAPAKYVALGTGEDITGVVEFDNFYLRTLPDFNIIPPDQEQFFEEFECSICQKCCWPYVQETPEEVTATIHNIASEGGGCLNNLPFCDDFDGMEFHLPKVDYLYTSNENDPLYANCAYYELGGLDFHCIDNDIVYDKASLIVGVNPCKPFPEYYQHASCAMVFRIWSSTHGSIPGGPNSLWGGFAFQGWQKIIEWPVPASMDKFCGDWPITLDQIETPYCGRQGHVVIDVP